MSVDRGWGVETSNIRNVNESDDPMLQQMQIMRNYIQQARYANDLQTNVRLCCGNLSNFLKIYFVEIYYSAIAIESCRRANRYDDVVILEANLRDLQIEHERMQSQS